MIRWLTGTTPFPRYGLIAFFILLINELVDLLSWPDG